MVRKKGQEPEKWLKGRKTVSRGPEIRIMVLNRYWTLIRLLGNCE